MNATWPRRYDLASRARLDAARALDGSAAAELAMLVGLGVIAALLTSVTASPIRVPGHAILRGMLPLVFGLSLVPRRGAGSAMSAAAVVTWLTAGAVGGAALPLAAGTGLAALGPALDVALARAVRPGWGLYLRFALAGLVANLLAFAVRMASEAPAVAAVVATGARRHGSGLGGGMGNGTGGSMGRGMGSAAAAGFSWPAMLVSFALCGVAAGLVCGLIWFRTSPRSQESR